MVNAVHRTTWMKIPLRKWRCTLKLTRKDGFSSFKFHLIWVGHSWNRRIPCKMGKIVKKVMCNGHYSSLTFWKWNYLWKNVKRCLSKKRVQTGEIKIFSLLSIIPWRRYTFDWSPISAAALLRKLLLVCFITII